MATVEFAHVTKDFNADVRAVDDLNLSIADGEFVVFVGPSGCGKTTALRMTAGLEAISSGEIAIDGRVVNAVPSAKRDIAMVFQNYALYPHMTVFENMAFGLQQQRVGKREVERRVREIAALLELDAYLTRKPRALSGGQRQRVAMGRAIVRSPAVFLMDEPLSNLDAKLRVQMRAEIRSLQQRLGTTTIYVTHDQVEAMTMGDRVAVLRGGVLQQVAPPHELYHRPANIFVAEFIGSPAMNLLPATIDGSDLVVGTTRVHAPQWSGAGRPAGRLVVGIRPEDVEVGTGQGLPGRVLHVEDLGSEIVAHLEVDVAGLKALVGDVIEEQEPGVEPLAELSDENAARVVARLPGSSRIAVGAEVNVTFDPAKAHLFDLRSGAAIARAAQGPVDLSTARPLGAPQVAQSNG